MGTLNVEMDTSTYSNNPKKYMLAVYGYDPTETAKNIYGVLKVPYQIPFMLFHSDDSDTINAETLTKELNIELNDVIATSYTKTFNPESAILDSPKLRGKNLIFKVSYKETTTRAIDTQSDDVQSGEEVIG